MRTKVHSGFRRRRGNSVSSYGSTESDGNTSYSDSPMASRASSMSRDSRSSFNSLCSSVAPFDSSVEPPRNRRKTFHDSHYHEVKTNAGLRKLVHSTIARLKVRGGCPLRSIRREIKERYGYTLKGPQNTKRLNGVLKNLTKDGQIVKKTKGYTLVMPSKPKPAVNHKSRSRYRSPSLSTCASRSTSGSSRGKGGSLSRTSSFYSEYNSRSQSPMTRGRQLKRDWESASQSRSSSGSTESRGPIRKPTRVPLRKVPKRKQKRKKVKKPRSRVPATVTYKTRRAKTARQVRRKAGKKRRVRRRIKRVTYTTMCLRSSAKAPLNVAIEPPKRSARRTNVAAAARRKLKPMLPCLTRDLPNELDLEEEVVRPPSRSSLKNTSKNPSRRSSRNPSRNVSRTTSRNPSRNASRNPSRSASRNASRNVSRAPSRASSRAPSARQSPARPSSDNNSDASNHSSRNASPSPSRASAGPSLKDAHSLTLDDFLL